MLRALPLTGSNYMIKLLVDFCPCTSKVLFHSVSAQSYSGSQGWSTTITPTNEGNRDLIIVTKHSSRIPPLITPLANGETSP